MEVEVGCPYCGEKVSFESPDSFAGNLSCWKCPHSFYVEVVGGKLKTVKKEASKKTPKSVLGGKEVW